MRIAHPGRGEAGRGHAVADHGRHLPQPALQVFLSGLAKNQGAGMKATGQQHGVAHLEKTRPTERDRD